MVEADLSFHFDITFDGEEAPRALMRDIVEIVVDDSLYLPDMFTLRIHDGGLRWVDSDLLAVGAEVTIWAASIGGTQTETSGQLIEGEVTALAPNFSRTGEPTLTVRGYDRSHRLHRGKKSRSFRQVTDGEIAQRIAREAKLRARIDPTSVIHDYVFQDNQTDLELLQTRAQQIGYEVYVKEKTLYFTRRETRQQEGPTLTWGENLRDFQPHLSTMHQVDEVVVRSWDPRRKREIVSRVSEGQIAPEVGVAESGGELTRQAFGVASQLVVVDRPVGSIDEANAIAQALYDELSGDFIKAKGVCFGDPHLQAGCTVEVRDVGFRFSGRYFVTSATHIQNQDGYETLFTISGRKPDTISNLLQEASEGAQGWGIAIGLVTNNRDPEGRGRVKVRFPWLSDSEESRWARMAMPMGGKDKGLYCLPEINDEVLVAFEHGTINHPYVLGVLWNGQDQPPRRNDEVVGRDGKVNQRIMRSRSGHEIVLDDTDGHERIIIRDKTGQNQIVIDSEQNDMTISVQGDLTLEAGGEVNIKSKGDLSIQSDGKGDIGARDVTVEGDSKVDVKGGVINLN